MILKKIYLYPDLVEFNNYPELDKIRYETRSLCNFIERHLKGAKFQVDGFNQIGVIWRRRGGEPYIDSSNNLIIPIEFSMDRYRGTPDNELQNFFVENLITGLKLGVEFYSIPLDFIVKWIDVYKNSGYVNEWVVSKFKCESLDFQFIASLNMTGFDLRISVGKGEQELWSEYVFSTKPDEIFFDKKLGKGMLSGANVEFKDKSGLLIYKKSIKSIKNMVGL